MSRVATYASLGKTNADPVVLDSAIYPRDLYHNLLTAITDKNTRTGHVTRDVLHHMVIPYIFDVRVVAAAYYGCMRFHLLQCNGRLFIRSESELQMYGGAAYTRDAHVAVGKVYKMRMTDANIYINADTDIYILSKHTGQLKNVIALWNNADMPQYRDFGPLDYALGMISINRVHKIGDHMYTNNETYSAHSGLLSSKVTALSLDVDKMSVGIYNQNGVLCGSYNPAAHQIRMSTPFADAPCSITINMPVDNYAGSYLRGNLLVHAGRDGTHVVFRVKHT